MIEDGQTSPTWHTLSRLLAAIPEDILRSKRAADRPEDRQGAAIIQAMIERGSAGDDQR